MLCIPLPMGTYAPFPRMTMSTQRTPSPRILLITDDELQRRSIETMLTEHGYVVSSPLDTAAVSMLLPMFEPDVTIMCGREHIFRELRMVRERSDCLTLLIQQTTDPAERVELLHAGGDDVVEPSISLDEIAARCATLLRRRPVEPAEQPSGTEAIGPLEVDRSRHEVRLDGEVVPATRIEFSLLSELVRFSDQVVTREALLEGVWGTNWVGDTHVVDVHLSNLRRKLAKVLPDVPIIKTVRGVGFRVSDEISEYATANA